MRPELLVWGCLGSWFWASGAKGSGFMRVRCAVARLEFDQSHKQLGFQVQCTFNVKGKVMSTNVKVCTQT